MDTLTGNLKIAFDGIRAEEKLKAKTILYLQSEIKNRDRNFARNPVRRFAAVLASVAVIVLFGVYSFNLYFTPSAYVDIDVNPSIELALNRFDRVIGIRAYNEDGKDIISSLSLKHKQYEDALIALINAINQTGFIQGDGLVSVTLQAINSDKEAGMLAKIQTDVTDYIMGRHHGVQIEVFSVSGDIQALAHEQGISPAMYLAIQELIAVDSTVTVDSCRGHSINSIRQRTQEHMGNQHNNGNAGNNNEPAGDGGNIEPNDEGVQGSGQGNEHHGNGRGNGHHGSGH